MAKGKNLNIPKRMLAQYKDEYHTELIAASICIKCAFGDSLVRDFSIRTLQKVLHCGFKTAQRLYHAMMSESDFFYYNEQTNTLLAKNFKRRYTYIDTDKKGNRRWQMYAIKIENKIYKLREAKKLIKELLFLNAVNAIERKDEFICKKQNPNPSFISNNPLTQKGIARMCGLSGKQAAYRLVKGLEKKGIIRSTRAEIILFTDCLSDEALKAHAPATYKTFVGDNGFLYEIKPKTYHFTSCVYNRSFCNVNFNHKKRYHLFEKKTLMLQNEERRRINAYFERMEH